MYQSIKFVLIAYLLLTTNIAYACDPETDKKGGFKNNFDETITNEEVWEYVRKFRDAVVRDDRVEVARLANCKTFNHSLESPVYPCRWNQPGHHDEAQSKKSRRAKEFDITSGKIFLENYDKIITERFRRKIAKIRDIGDIMSNSYGFAMCNGLIWFIPKYGIGTFNPEPDYPSEECSRD